jgi:phenol 2-monooxygenase (NADPH)
VQFYLDGYRPGDPFVAERHRSATEPEGELPSEVDVLIVGCGPAGLVLAAQLANFPDVKTAIVDRADGPLAVGQADGVACRTVEMLEAFGLADRLLAESYWVNEVCFWAPDPGDPGRIVRTGRVRDTDEELSECPHVTVNQARLLAHLRDYMERSPTRLRPVYGLHATEVTIEPPSTPYPVRVTFQHLTEPGDCAERLVVSARYVVGCDGARSTVRKAIGRELVGDATDTAWGVMDLLAVTDFPDIRLKSVIRSANEGNILVIPREGGYLVRLYIELDAVGDREGVLGETVTPERLLAVANRILHPYTLEAKQIGWWSVYEIGQRLCDKFDDVPESAAEVGRLPRVFIAGDACHTHSAKAGQGMNVSLADTWNLGWKLAAVLQGQARPELLHTYSAERQAVAQELIDFDREFARVMSAPPKLGQTAHQDAGDAGEFQQYFAEQLRFTAGTATRYGPSMITASTTHQHLAGGFPVGMRFHSAPVVRLADARRVQLGHVARADGAWRLYVFADGATPTSAASRCRALCEYLDSEASPLRRFTPSGAATDAVIDVRAIWQQAHRDVALESLPAVLLPRKGRFGLVDYEKVFCAIPGEANIFELRGISREEGCVVVVRPDQFVAHVLPLDAHAELTDFFEGILLEARGS